MNCICISYAQRILHHPSRGDARLRPGESCNGQCLSDRRWSIFDWKFSRIERFWNTLQALYPIVVIMLWPSDLCGNRLVRRQLRPYSSLGALVPPLYPLYEERSDCKRSKCNYMPSWHARKILSCSKVSTRTNFLPPVPFEVHTVDDYVIEARESLCWSSKRHNIISRVRIQLN